jgi:hypothetical protein
MATKEFDIGKRKTGRPKSLLDYDLENTDTEVKFIAKEKEKNTKKTKKQSLTSTSTSTSSESDVPIIITRTVGLALIHDNVFDANNDNHFINDRPETISDYHKAWLFPFFYNNNAHSWDTNMTTKWIDIIARNVKELRTLGPNLVSKKNAIRRQLSNYTNNRIKNSGIAKHLVTCSQNILKPNSTFAINGVNDIIHRMWLNFKYFGDDCVLPYHMREFFIKISTYCSQRYTHNENIQMKDYLSDDHCYIVTTLRDYIMKLLVPYYVNNWIDMNNLEISNKIGKAAHLEIGSLEFRGRLNFEKIKLEMDPEHILISNFIKLPLWNHLVKSISKDKLFKKDEYEKIKSPYYLYGYIKELVVNDNDSFFKRILFSTLEIATKEVYLKYLSIDPYHLQQVKIFEEASKQEKDKKKKEKKENDEINGIILEASESSSYYEVAYIIGGALGKVKMLFCQERENNISKGKFWDELEKFFVYVDDDEVNVSTVYKEIYEYLRHKISLITSDRNTIPLLPTSRILDIMMDMETMIKTEFFNSSFILATLGANSQSYMVNMIKTYRAGDKLFEEMLKAYKSCGASSNHCDEYVNDCYDRFIQYYVGATMNDVTEHHRKGDKEKEIISSVTFRQDKLIKANSNCKLEKK